MLDSVLDWIARLRGERRAVGFVATSTTDRGLVRGDNQDAFACVPEEGFLCVADGMGGGEGGALASEWTSAALLEAWRAGAAEALEAREARLNEALQEVNGRIRAHAKEKGYRMMGTTLAAVLHDCVGGGYRARIVHVGDSRVYRYRLGRLDVLTRDHTVGNELGSALAKTSADEADSLRSRGNPLTHILTRAVGTEMRVRPEWKTVDVQRGDRYLLCSDGVHDMLSDAEISVILKESSSPRAAMARIEAAVRSAGAGDNYTILCAWAGGRSPLRGQAKKGS